MSDELSAEALVAAVRETFDGEVVEVRPRGNVGRWPEALARGPRQVRAYADCADCETRGTWIRFGPVPLCPPCAWARWRSEQLEHWRT